MSDHVLMIAKRIKELREITGNTVSEVSTACGISSDVYCSYEDGSVDIPVGVLHSVSQFFNVALTTLLTGEEPHLHSVALTRAGKGVPVKRRDAYGYRNLAANFAGRKAEPFIVRVNASRDGEAPELNSHPGQEFDYLLSGRLCISIGGKDYFLEPGDSVYYDSGLPHGMKAMDGKTAEFIAVIF